MCVSRGERENRNYFHIIQDSKLYLTKKKAHNGQRKKKMVFTNESRQQEEKETKKVRGSEKGEKKYR